MKKNFLGLIFTLSFLPLVGAQCDFFEDISVSTSGFNTNPGFLQNYVLVSSTAGAPTTIVGLNATGDFSGVPEGTYFIYAVNVEGSLPGSLAVGASWNTFVNTSGAICKEISVPYLNREVFVCGLEEVCMPNSIQVNASGFTATNTQTYILCSTNPENIIAFNTTGVFTSTQYNTTGIYTVYAVNSSDTDVLNSFQVGASFSSVRTISSGECADISTPKALEINNCSVLPITLLDFDALPFENEVLLTWKTLSEVNNDYFTIERSSDLNNWTSIGKIDGAGNSNYEIEYETLDKNPLSGISYYRLKQTDFNGAFTYSHVEVVEYKDSYEVSVFPNPANEFMHIRSEQKIVKHELYNVLNQLIETNISQSQIDVRDLAAGNYLLKIYFSTGESMCIKVVVTH
jgi:hypothetical protein